MMWYDLSVYHLHGSTRLLYASGHVYKVFNNWNFLRTTDAIGKCIPQMSVRNTEYRVAHIIVSGTHHVYSIVELYTINAKVCSHLTV